MDEQKLRRKTKHSSSSESSGSDDERKSSRKRRREKKKRREEAKRKDKKKHRKKRHRSSSTSASNSDEDERSKKRRLLKEAKKIIKSHKKETLGAKGDLSSHKKLSLSRKVITQDDYYEKNKEFSMWLRDELGLYFSNLSAEETRKLFLDFVDAWNSGKLSERLYNGIHSTTRTDHKWHIRGEDESYIDKDEEQEFMKNLEKSQRKKFQKEHNILIDELLPKATGRDRLVEKKVMRKEAARMREESPELLKEQDIMGGSDDFKQRLERERARREKKIMERDDALREKRLAADQREVAAMDQFKALVNVSGGKITIPKRVQ